jgi:trimeric autotransporter adhesin
VEASVPGLDFITRLRPVTYTYDLGAIDKIIWPNGRPNIEGENRLDIPTTNTTTRFTGFIAQEVEDAAKSIGYEFSGVDAPENETDLYGLRYSEFVVPLVKAVQEQQEMIETQKSQLELQAQKLEAMQKQMDELKTILTEKTVTAENK